MPRGAVPDPKQIAPLVALIHQEQFTEAEQRAQSLLATFPESGVLWKVLSVAQVRLGKDGLAALRQASELLPEDGEAHRNLGAALYDRGQWAEALESLQRALLKQPDDVSTLIDAANTLRKLERPAEAVPLYERALKQDPGEAEAHNNLGNAWLELKEYQNAELCYERALILWPGNAQIHCNRGFVRSAQRRLAEAAACYRQALASDPKLIDALNGLGNTLRDLGDRREAATLFRRAIEVDAARAESHANLGAVLFEMRRVDEAVASFKRALELAENHVPAQLGLALALRQQRRPEEAEEQCRAALEADPRHVEALCLLGELRADRGRFAEAEALFQRAIDADPEHAAAAYAGIATHRRMSEADSAWLRGAEALSARPLSLAQQISLQYALGKYFDDTGQYDRAFEHYTRANESTKRYGARHDRERLRQRVSRIIQSFDGRPGASPGAAADSELPILIVGMPRSGTSLAEQILASHPAVFGAGELVYWNGAYDAFSADAARGGTAAASVATLAVTYLERLRALGGGASRVIDKMPANFWYLGLVHAAFPRARIIHMQRHPFDTCLSIYFQNFFNIGPYANDLGDLAQFYGEYLRVMRHWRRVLPANVLLEVPYEALVEAPEEWSRRMLAFVGLPWDPRCLDFHQTDRVVITASKWQVRQRISKSSVGRWRNYSKHLGPLQPLAAAAPPVPGSP